MLTKPQDEIIAIFAASANPAIAEGTGPAGHMQTWVFGLDPPLQLKQ